jgi:hypothetical protein
MKVYGGVDVQIRIFLTSALAGGEWSASRLGRFTPRDRALRTHWIGGWVDPRAGLDGVEKNLYLCSSLKVTDMCTFLYLPLPLSSLSLIYIYI